jgi:hypothetical protein
VILKRGQKGVKYRGLKNRYITAIIISMLIQNRIVKHKNSHLTAIIISMLIHNFEK